MILDGDVKQKQAFFRRLVLKFVDDLVKGRLVADIAMFLGQWNIHILHAFKLVESQQRICLIALPGSAFARMDGKGTIAIFLEQGGKRSGRLQYILLVRDAARRQKCHRVSGQELKFAGTGSCSKNRGIAVTLDTIVQRVYVVGDAFA